MYRFRGFPPFLEASATRMGLHPYRAAEARRVSELHKLADLVAQASDPHKHPRERAAILTEAGYCRDRLGIAYAAAESILDEAHEGLDVPMGERKFNLTVVEPDLAPEPEANLSRSRNNRRSEAGEGIKR